MGSEMCIRDSSLAARNLILDNGDGTYTTALAAGQARAKQAQTESTPTPAPAPAPSPEEAPGPGARDMYFDDARQVFRSGQVMNAGQLAAELSIGVDRAQTIINQLVTGGLVTGDADSGYRMKPGFTG